MVFFSSENSFEKKYIGNNLFMEKMYLTKKIITSPKSEREIWENAKKSFEKNAIIIKEDLYSFLLRTYPNPPMIHPEFDKVKIISAKAKDDSKTPIYGATVLFLDDNIQKIHAEMNDYLVIAPYTDEVYCFPISVLMHQKNGVEILDCLYGLMNILDKTKLCSMPFFDQIYVYKENQLVKLQTPLR